MVKVQDKEYFSAKAIADALGYKNPQEAIRDNCKGRKKVE